MGETLSYAFDGWVGVVACCYFTADGFDCFDCRFGGAGDDDVYGCLEDFFVLWGC